MGRPSVPQACLPALTRHRGESAPSEGAGSHRTSAGRLRLLVAEGKFKWGAGAWHPLHHHRTRTRSHADRGNGGGPCFHPALLQGRMGVMMTRVPDRSLPVVSPFCFPKCPGLSIWVLSRANLGKLSPRTWLASPSPNLTEGRSGCQALETACCWCHQRRNSLPGSVWLPVAPRTSAVKGRAMELCGPLEGLLPAPERSFQLALKPRKLETSPRTLWVFLGYPGMYCFGGFYNEEWIYFKKGKSASQKVLHLGWTTWKRHVHGEYRIDDTMPMKSSSHLWWMPVLTLITNIGQHLKKSEQVSTWGHSRLSWKQTEKRAP